MPRVYATAVRRATSLPDEEAPVSLSRVRNPAQVDQKSKIKLISIRD